MGMSDPVSMGEAVRNYISRPDKTRQEVRVFRSELKSNLTELMYDSEKDIENTLVGHQKEPEVYPVFTPSETRLGPDRLLISLSACMFDISRNHKHPVHKELQNSGMNAVGTTALELINGHRENKFDWSGKYERTDNSLLINEVPKKVLPGVDKVPDILYPLWNALNTSVESHTGRSHGIGLSDTETRISHEMTHALNSNAASPLKNDRTAAIDEATAMTTTYALSGTTPDIDRYSDILDTERLRRATKHMKQHVDNYGDSKKAVSKIRAASILSIKEAASEKISVDRVLKKNLSKV
jgi:hypothetical protein